MGHHDGRLAPMAHRRPRAVAAAACAGLFTLQACAAPASGPASDTTPTPEGAHLTRVDGHDRTYLVAPPDGASGEPHPLLIMFHGTGDTAEGQRAWVGDDLERLAGERDAIVAYLGGHENNWNECRRAGDWPAKADRIDDVGFARTVVDEIDRTIAPVDRDRVFAGGYSSGGHMAMRMAREAPDLVAAIAVIAANPPAPENQACPDLSRPIPALFVQNGQDPVNPIEGGEVTVGGFNGSRGRVLSAVDGAQLHADANGASGPERTELEHGITVLDWSGDAPVRQVSVPYETHNFPQTPWNAPAAMWEFFDGVS